MARNPKWHRDELILTLDLYFQLSSGEIHARNPRIIKLSADLNRLPLFADRPDSERFRNPNGVGLKLSNFLAIDPSYAGKGMRRYGKLDEQIFFEFVNERVTLSRLAGKIREAITNKALRVALSQVENDESEEGVYEGQILLRLHKFRERNAQMVRKKKAAVIRATGRLACEVCGFDFFEKYGALGEGFAECHHVQPLSVADSTTQTRMGDLAIVCSNCHRMLHRGEKWLGINELKKSIRLVT
jgi:5-methylcytosine-specific restriction protein A